ncbi:DUF1080 domain-containing protein [Sphingobacterium sp. DK4209]|uniref:DUF1080 domain-containing protein n=1 Tax=Sphingobacterium zhuxiongii TaxID=2662364 RepID=A0A5Q0QHY9_9SPHI|nr:MULTISPECIES: DUF1080 domain-containing protein [unclassified Sphingobacterium]MVZ66065.1 DUF1080 domain-containing protein [Sphingobacterium sp. DK4209]QGA27482.1 DUF1080 domain-containing protein [Sphingobacterium sp. dk4302]
MKKLKNLAYSSMCLSALLLTQACNGNTSDKKAEGGQDSTTQSVGEQSFVSMLDQNSLNGWEGDSTIWTVKDGVLTGEIKPGAELKNNTFLIWKGGEPGDFVLRAKFKISEKGNSGINYRSERFTELPYALKGYQADIDGKKNYTGQNYEERKRTTLAYRGERAEIGEIKEGVVAEAKGNAWTNRNVLDTLDNADNLKNAIKSEDWNEIEIVAEGNKLSHYVNGKLMSEVIDNDSKNKSDKGLIGVQVHVGPPMKIEYKDMQIKFQK